MIHLVLLPILLVTIANGVTTSQNCVAESCAGECIDIPDDDCDPLKGGIDCPTICDPYDGRFCGGIAGIQCETGYACPDDPNDQCDPLNGGADCGGICRKVCDSIQGCQDGYECIDDPLDNCDPAKDSDCSVCQPVIDYNGEFCGGIAGIQCVTGYECVDDPNDDCDPNNGGTDCGGLCHSQCGGLAGLQCPSDEFTCVDIPGDGCDTKNGADCLGFCEPVTVACTADAQQCCDGTYVSRDPENNCEFRECKWPEPNAACDWTGTCEYGSETCCGETYAAYSCQCDPDTGLTACFNTDACMGAFSNGCGDTTETPDICTLSSDVGDCDAVVPRWFYNSETGACEMFDWGGCGGNKNNFETEKACIDACESISCTADVQECCDGTYVSRDPENNCAFPDCEPPTPNDACDWVGTCEYGSEICCGETYPSLSCECDADTRTTTCVQASCDPNCPTTTTAVFCADDVAECCGGTISRDPENNCQFPECSCAYASCGGFAGLQCADGYECIDDPDDNCDPLTSGADCIGICTPVEEDICDLPQIVGPCEAAMPRYYYNSEEGECEEFTYGGCDGNANNFETIQECEKSCEDACDLSAEKGDGNADFDRYYYNADTGLCESFYYGGSGGNANNFVATEDCQEECAYSECKYADQLFRFDPIKKICKFCFQNYWKRNVCKALVADVNDGGTIDFESNGFIVNKLRNQAQCLLDYCKTQNSKLDSKCELFNVRFDTNIDITAIDKCTCDLIYCDMTVTLGSNVGRLGMFIGFVLGVVTISWM